MARRTCSGDFAAGDEAVVGVTFHNALAPGRYALSALLTRRGGGDAALDRREYFKNIVVTGARPGGGLVDLAHDVAIAAGGPVSALPETAAAARDPRARPPSAPASWAASWP